MSTTVETIIHQQHAAALANIRRLLADLTGQVEGLASDNVGDRKWTWTVAPDVQPGSLVYVPAQGRWERCHKIEGVLDDVSEAEWILLHFYVGPRNIMHWPLEPTVAVQVATEPVGDDGPVQQILKPVRP